MSTRAILPALLVLMLAIAGGYWRWGARDSSRDSLGGEVIARTETQPSAEHPRDEVAAAVIDGRPVDTPDYAGELESASNYLTYLNALRPDAEAGDPLAQLFTFRAMEYCRMEYPFYFRSRNRKLTLDEGVRRVSTRWPYRSDYARLVHQRCHDLFESGKFENLDAVDFLRSAATAGEPRAQALLASLMFRRSPRDPESLEAVVSVEESRRLLGSALRSREPEVILQAGSLMYAIFGDEIWEHEHSAWTLAACQRGADCGPESERAFFACLYDTCQPYEGLPEMIRRYHSAEFPTIEQRAREISALIDAGEWEQLGFGETVSDE